ncbi:MAG: hypothetical protein IKP68_12115 [Clostridia bacterium]|nr:hypothetical protein [Clostridia bacterium]
MKKSWKCFIACLLCFLIPFIFVVSLGFFIPPQFDLTFLGELKYKVDRLYSIKEPKIVVIGGSSVPFGVDSGLMEEMVGMPVVNFGLYATLGTKLMLDLSLGAIRKGDVIIIAPETDPQTYSLYFNAEAAWQAADSDFSILLKMSGKDAPKMIGGFWKYTYQKVKYALASEHLDPSGIYNRASFDEYGDISYERPYNVMTLGYDSNTTVKFSPDIISTDFIDYVNEYTKKAETKGATVLFSFSPVNEDGIDPSTTLGTLNEFTSFIDEKFTAKRISDPNDYLYRSGYFYDSNFHVNDAGMTLHTATLAKDIATALGVEIKKTVDIPPVPEKPDDPEFPTVEFDENEKYFTFAEMNVGGKLVGYKIVGVSDEGKAQKTLITPVVYNKKAVIMIGAGALNGCAELEEVTVSRSIRELENGAFAGAPKLTKIHILEPDPELVTVDCFVDDPRDGLCRGMNEKARFYVPAEAVNDYQLGYFWAKYRDWIVSE